MGNFKDLGVNKGLLKSIEELGFTSPTPVQEQAIPHLLKDKTDLIALAQTGTGKTAAFLRCPISLDFTSESTPINSRIFFKYRRSSNCKSSYRRNSIWSRL